MSYFILIFHRDRRSQGDTRVERLEDSQEALDRLLEIEGEFDDQTEMGVVMLVAEDEETIRATHAQYFKSLEELLDAAEA